MAKNTSDVKKVRVTLIKSPISYNIRQKQTVKALGLRRLNTSRVLPLTPSIKGMIDSVSHVLKVEEVSE